MGQQQLLLVILVTILVGIATVVAINVFGDAAEQGNRDAVRQDLIQGAASIQAIWARPAALGGVQGDFTTDPPSDAEFSGLIGIPGGVNDLVITNENAQYTIDRSAADEVSITAVPVTYGSNIVLTVTRLDAPATDGSSWWVRLDDQGSGGGPVTLSGGEPPS